MSIVTKTGSLIISLGGMDKWIKFTSKSKACEKWGLREIVKEYNPNGKLKNLSYTFSTNPLFGYQRVSGAPEKMAKVWKSVTNLDTPKAVEDMLNFCKKFNII